jgi:hypothetical protein
LRGWNSNISIRASLCVGLLPSEGGGESSNLTQGRLKSIESYIMYRALHPSLTIRQSDIHGLGIFATTDIPEYTILGISHVADQSDLLLLYEKDAGRYTNGRYHYGYIRTPLGGCINHSDDPSCIKTKVNNDGSYSSLQGSETSTTMAIETIRDIIEGEELTVSYTLYSLEKGE